MKNKNNNYRMEALCLLGLALWLGGASILVNQHILDRETMMGIVPTPVLFFSLVGFAIFFLKNNGRTWAIVKTIVWSIFVALVSFYLFLVLTFNSAL